MLKRVDSNQKEIIKVLRQVGCTVMDLHEVGKGCPDILVGANIKGKKHNFLMEIKTTKGRLTAAEKKFHSLWRGAVVIVRNSDEALRVLGI